MTTATVQRLRVLIDTVEPPDLPHLSDELVRSLDLPDDLPCALAIGEVAALTGISAHTLRYYERIGLLDVPRDAVGRRVYGSAALGRVIFLTRLRMADMPIRDIQHYIELVQGGREHSPRTAGVPAVAPGGDPATAARSAGGARGDRLQDHHLRRTLPALSWAPSPHHIFPHFPHCVAQPCIAMPAKGKRK